jgi:glycosyltransferase involved in cell wall biosynthesis
LGDNDVALLAFGGTRVEKRLDLAVSALRQLPSNVHLVVEGAEDEIGRDEIVAWARAAGVEGRVLLHLARVDEARMPDVFAAADVVLAPYAPGFGGVSGPVSQAAAYGVPIVVSDLPELATGLRACGIGAFARPGDAVSVGEAVRSALAHLPTAANTTRFRAAHSEATFGSRMVEAYLEVLGRR